MQSLSTLSGTIPAIKDVLDLDWQNQVQGVNVADYVFSKGDDVQVWSGETIVWSVEITIQPVGKDLLQATPQSKISPASIRDRLFLVTTYADMEAVRHVQQGATSCRGIR